ncbi:hypothetical protein [Bordetella genomosp. 13]|uniref:Uncharacterized protein n=1 Tax=Bordetella genomosp. 13 TaxID=463040 RepID=A0A1W6Z6K4_9BORD|nr:hypothetical protein [Bordetella genomosp. 13]ARP93021.1 hypothetical protein CAL15_00680 [Bordetella genomosp. 13]
MSWRVLFATLLLAVGAAAWGGIQLGDWLVAHAPQASPAPGQEEGAASQQPVLDANGRPYVAQPPQPRVDGTLGVPEKPTGSEWTIPTVSLFETVTDPSVQISRTNVTMDEAQQLAANSDVPLPSGGSDVTTLDLQSLGSQGTGVQPTATPIRPAPGVSMNQQPLVGQGPPVTMAQAPQAQPAPPQNNPGNWQDALRRELAQCADRGFFERPTCSWNARNKYCAPNRAWGAIAECPQRP